MTDDDQYLPEECAVCGHSVTVHAWRGRCAVCAAGPPELSVGCEGYEPVMTEEDARTMAELITDEEAEEVCDLPSPPPSSALRG